MNPVTVMVATALDDILEKGAESKIVKPTSLRIGDVAQSELRYAFEYWNYLMRFVNECGESFLSRRHPSFFHDYCKLIEATKLDYGVSIENEELVLYPIEPDIALLSHFGLMIVKPYNNLRNLREHGVFGCPDSRYPTYLARHGSYISISDTTGFDRLTLIIDKDKLMQKRNIFIDPETIDEDSKMKDKLGNSYLVLGGIPREAIINYRLRESYSPRKQQTTNQSSS